MTAFWISCAVLGIAWLLTEATERLPGVVAIVRGRR